MAEKNNSLVRKPSSAVEKVTPSKKHILSGMVADTLAVANAQLENWYQTGEKYYFGKGMPKNYTEAAKWFLKAAERGHIFAQTSLGACYEKGGYGFSKDYSQAVKWYRMAAEQGEEYAQNNLGACYANGIGVPKDRTEAVKWYRMAADQGNELAKTNLGLLNEKWEGAFDYPEAIKSLRKIAEQGFAPAQYNLGIHYENGDGVPQDNNQAAHWYRKAAEQGYTLAEEKLTLLLAKGK